MHAEIRNRSSTILLLDEQVQACREVCLRLEASGYAVTATCTRAEATALVESRPFDTVVADIALTDPDGAALLRATQRRSPPVPLIILSAESEVDSILRAIHLGAFDYVIKDRRLEPLCSAVRRGAERGHLLQKNAQLLRDLHRVNAELEERVERRGRQLEQANVRLGTESMELQRAVGTLKDTHSQLVQAEKTASLGLLTAGVAHEINNPLGFVLPNLSVLEQWVTGLDGEASPTPELAREMLEVVHESREGLLRIRDIVQELSLFSRRSPTADERVNLSRVIQSVCRLFGGQLRCRSLLRSDLHDTPDVRGDAGQLRQVVLNLLINASHAIPENATEGQILVRSRHVGDHVQLQIADNGAGIPPELLGKVFDPFFTTKPVGKGTGMGLAISRQLVERMGGELRIDSAVGDGTTVSIVLNVWERSAR